MIFEIIFYFYFTLLTYYDKKSIMIKKIILLFFRDVQNLKVTNKTETKCIWHKEKVADLG